jgi:hypothetical protein
MTFWKRHLSACAHSIQQKLATLGCLFPEVDEPGGFNVFGFIDNTMNATCRPGGGPMRDGVNAPRNDPLIQRAFYNGWKKLHGIKWQTIDLPNGMNFHCYGPSSLRHNDLWQFRESDINTKLLNLQVSYYLFFIIINNIRYNILYLFNI